MPPALDKAQPGLTSDDYYFDSYAHYGIHQEMIKDSVRTDAYMKAICGNPQLFEGKTVLDVGCGTGILSLFAAEAGAAKVYAADCSRIVDQARQIVSDNGFSDTIEVVEGRVEEVELPGVGDGVDIIISEWMGYFLLYESMLDSVVVARDRWLRPGGIVLPDRAVLKVCGIEDEGQRYQNIEFWDDVYGFDMGCIKPIVQAEPLVEDVALDQIVTSKEVVFQIDIGAVSVPELSFAAPFALRATEQDRCSALAFSFDVVFSHRESTVILPTGPRTKSTHWKQGLALPRSSHRPGARRHPRRLARLPPERGKPPRSRSRHRGRPSRHREVPDGALPDAVVVRQGFSDVRGSALQDVEHR